MILHPEHIVRGFPVGEDEYVIVHEDELQSVQPRKTRDIDLRQFVDRGDVPPIFFERAYFLTPAGDSTRAYRLLTEVMQQTDRAGIATFVMRDKEYLVAILADAYVLRAETLRFSDEIRSPQNVGLPERKPGSPQLVADFRKAIRELHRADLDESDLEDKGDQQLRELVQSPRASCSRLRSGTISRRSNHTRCVVLLSETLQSTDAGRPTSLPLHRLVPTVVSRLEISAVHRFVALALFACGTVLLVVRAGMAEEADVEGVQPMLSAGEPDCFAETDFQEVWMKVVQRTCLKCHQGEGEASDSEFLLSDESRVPSSERPEVLAQNQKVLARFALTRDEDGQSRLLVKPRGGLDHGGGEVLPADSTGFRLLVKYVAAQTREPDTNFSSARDASMTEALSLDDDRESLLEGVELISDQRLLRRVTLSLAARLPTDDEFQAVEQSGLAAVEPILSEIMQEEAFYQRLVEGFNDIFLTVGYTGLGLDILSYNHFQKSRLWYQKHSLDHLPEEDRQKARYRLSDQYQESLRREPMELVRYIVEQERPFTEIVTADYMMVSPYSARGYGIFEEIKDRFDAPDDPFEYIPTQLPALTARNGDIQPTEEGLYPHAGMLTMFQYLRRYPTTETNRNRLRARMYYQHFLGVDVMSLAPQVSDAAAVEAKYDNPTMQAASCVVCHRTIDPIAGLFQEYYNEDGHYGPRKDGWFEDMFEPGREGVDLPESADLRKLQWLGEQTATDPRFATAMVEHVYYILTGRQSLKAPEDIERPQFAERRRAYLVQRDILERAAEQFVAEEYNLKVVFQALVASPLYRADGLAASDASPERLAELDDMGVVRMLGPEQLERKIVAIFGRSWGRLDGSYSILYGGIDSKEVTERLADPSGAVGALQRIMANDVACKNVAADFKLPADQRRLFPGIEPDVVIDQDTPEAERKIRAAIVHLHHHILGREDSPDDAEVDLTYRLLADVVDEATSRENFDQRESYFCKSSDQEGPRDDDPNYMIRGWRAVVTYLLRRHEFLYE